MPAISVQHCHQEFTDRVQESLDLARQARNFAFLDASGAYRSIGVRRIELFAGLSLLRIHLGWETFLEAVFTRYMCGATTASGFSPKLLGSPELNTKIAMRRLLALGSWPYLTWNYKNTTKWANMYFNMGEPFITALSSIALTMDDILIVRNSFAHRSDSAAQRFRTVILRMFGYVPRGTSPGRFLLMPNPLVTGQNMLETYANSLLSASATIIP